MVVDLSLSDIYRASDVSRWQIVKTMKTQSVAEHSFQVAMITGRICQILGKDELFTARATRYALHHDLGEVLTGDIASPVKKMINTEALAEFEGSIRVFGEPIATDPECVDIVKLADTLEAVKFLFENATTDQGRRIRETLTGKAAELAFRLGVSAVMGELLFHPGFIMGVDGFHP